jgi:hypothetical protein
MIDEQNDGSQLVHVLGVTVIKGNCHPASQTILLFFALLLLFFSLFSSSSSLFMSLHTPVCRCQKRRNRRNRRNLEELEEQ